MARVHIARPFRNENCMQCHSTSGRIWSDVPDHNGLLEDLRAGKTSCASVGCHGHAHPFSKPADAEAPTDPDAGLHQDSGTREGT